MKKIVNYLLSKNWILNIVRKFLSDEVNEKIDIAIFRSEFMFFGLDLSNMTDEEIKEKIKEIGKAFASFGLSIDEATIALAGLSPKNEYDDDKN